MATFSVMATALILKGTGDHSVLMGSDSAIGLNWFVVVNWKMEPEASLSGVMLTGGSVGPGLLCGISIHPSSMWLIGRSICGFGHRLPLVICFFFFCD